MRIHHTAALLIGLWNSFAGMSMPVLAQPQPPLPKAVEAEDRPWDAEVAFAELEREIQDVMDRQDATRQKIKHLQSELSATYQQTHGELLALRGVTDDTAARAAGIRDLERQQRLTALYISELAARGEAARGNVNEETRREINSKITAFHRQLAMNRAAGRKANDVRRKLAELQHRMMRMRHERMMRGNGRQFYDRTAELLDTDVDPHRPVWSDEPAEDPPGSGFEDGDLQSVTGELRKLLKLKWRKGELRFDRGHWRVPFAGKTLEDIRSEVDGMLAEKDVEIEEERQRVRHGNFSPPQLLFENLRQYATSQSGGGSRSNTSGGESWRFSFSNQRIQSEIGLDKEDVLRFVIQERRHPQRTLRLTDRGGDGLRLDLFGEDVFLRFKQDQDGSVQILYVEGEQVRQMRGANMAELYRREAKFVDHTLFRLLYHWGVHLPMSRFHPDVVARVQHRLAASGKADPAVAERLVAQLDDDRFEVRADAAEALLEQADAFHGFLEQRLATDELSPEARHQIEAIMEQNAPHRYAVDAFIREQQLLKDVAYLVALLGHANQADREAVIDVLRAETGVDHGGDVQAWRAWMAEQ